MNDSSDKLTSERIEQESASWVLRSDRGLTASEQDEFSAWLAADPRHRFQWARMRGHWKCLDALGKWRPEYSAKPNPDLLAPSRKRRFAPFALPALAAAAVIIVGLSIWVIREPNIPSSPAKAVLIASTSSQRVLEDGSVVDLNGNSEIAVNYTSTERRVRLLRGEAYFTVSRNPSRPFIVTAGELDVRAVGTAFNVRMEQESVNVLVTEGHVKLLSSRPEVVEAGLPNPADATPLDAPVLSPNQRAEVSLVAHPLPLRITTLSSGEIGTALSWQHRLLDFNSVPLADVVVEFNRRNTVQMIIQDPELASIPISATFHSDNVEGFLRLLATGFGAHVEHRSTSEILLSRQR